MSAPIPTEVEVGITNVRNAQLQFDQATENLQRIVNEHHAADDVVNAAGTALYAARDELFELIVEKPVTPEIQDDVTKFAAPIRVVAPWVPSEEDVDAAWSEKGAE